MSKRRDLYEGKEPVRLTDSIRVDAMERDTAGWLYVYPTKSRPPAWLLDDLDATLSDLRSRDRTQLVTNWDDGRVEITDEVAVL